MLSRVTENAIQVLADEHAELRTLFDRVSSPDEDRPAVLKQLVVTLSAHVSMEKQLLVPVLKERVNGGGDLAERLTNYHDTVERVLVLLDRRKVNSPDVPDLVAELLELTKGHIADSGGRFDPGARGWGHQRRADRSRGDNAVGRTPAPHSSTPPSPRQRTYR